MLCSQKLSFADPRQPTVDMHFCFLNLPPELRNRIYHFMLCEGNRATHHYIAKVKLPAITRVCSQLREETLALVFANHSFSLVTSSNVEERTRDRNSQELDQTKRFKPYPKRVISEDAFTRQRRKAGSLGLTSATRKTLKGLGQKAVFRNITSTVHGDANEASATRKGLKEVNASRSEPEAWLSFYNRKDATEGLKMQKEVKEVPGFYIRYCEADIGLQLDAAGEVAEKITSKPGFVGFHMQDLEAIARAFRYDGSRA